MSLMFEKVPEDIKDKLKKVRLDQDIAELGFICNGKLCEYTGYEELYERIWVWSKVSEGKIFIVATFDLGNTHCEIAIQDLFVPEIYYEHNKISKEDIANENLIKKFKNIKAEVIEYLPLEDFTRFNKLIMDIQSKL